MKALYKNFISILRRFPLSIAMNVAGLTLAFAAFIIILMEVQYEMTYDSRITQAGRIFHISKESPNFQISSHHSRPLIEQRCARISPEIERYALIEEWDLRAATEDRQTEFESKAHGITPQFFDMFEFDWVACDTSTFHRPQYLYIPESLARRVFHRTDLVGTAIWRLNNNEQWIIGGVYRDFPENCSVQNHVYNNLANYQANDWRNGRYFGYLQLRHPEKRAEVEKLLNDSLVGDGGLVFHLTAYNELFFHPELQTSYGNMPKADPKQRLIYLCICVLIILTAAINFTNFYTALTPLRMRSLNTQRVLGVRRRTLIRGLVSEGVFLALLAFALSLLVVLALEKSFVNDLLNVNIRLSGYPLILGLTGVIALLVGWLASVFPAHYATSFQPALVLKGNFGLTARGRRIRNVLIGIQLAVAMALVIIVGGIVSQNYYMRHSYLGYDQDRLMTISLLDCGVGGNDAEAFVSGLRQVACVEDVALSQFLLSAQFSHQVMSWGRVAQDGTPLQFICIPVSPNYLKVMGIRLLEGEDFNPQDKDNPMIFNRKAYATYPAVRVGKRVNDVGHIIGICEDFKSASLREEVQPTCLIVFSGGEYLNWGWRSSVNIRIKEGVDLMEAFAPIRDYCLKFAPDKQWEIKTQFQLMENIYRNERHMQQTLLLFSGLAVLIALSGVFGMTLFECNYRRKEIGLRKIMGATSRQIVRMFCLQYGRILLVGFVVAAPVAWYAVYYYLQNFAYKTPIHWWLFLLPFVLIGGITLLTVWFQCRQVARENPILSIRTE